MSTKLNRTSRPNEPAAPAVPLSAGIATIIDEMDGAGQLPNDSGMADHVKRVRPKPSAALRRNPATSGEPRKADLILKKMRSARGATIDTLVETSGWQAHSIRGFISGTVKKRMGLTVVSEPDKDGVRRYKIVSRSTLMEVANATE